MKGGRYIQNKLSKIMLQEKIAKDVKYTEFLFTDFYLQLTTDSIIANIPKPNIKEKLHKSAGNGSFVENFNTWLKIEAEPMHDFKRKHNIPLSNIKDDLLIRMYHSILETNKTDYENEILIQLLQDPNVTQGISLQFCRFYKISDKDTEDYNTFWKKIEFEFDKVGKDSPAKFYILNATISGTGTLDFTNYYKKIVPLSAYWDPFKASNINFKILDDTFYNKLYYEICKELFVATGIGFTIRQGTGNKEIILSLSSPTTQGQTIDFTLNRQGFSVNEIKQAIANLSNIENITDKELKNMITFLKTYGVTSDEHIISFLLMCKMSGDVGCVYFLKNISDYMGKVEYNDNEIDFNVANKPTMFIYTTDRLCGACAISNNVKCVIKCKPLNEAYICQYVGSNGTLESSVLEPYYHKIKEISGIDLKPLSDSEKALKLSQIYYKKFVATFSGAHFHYEPIATGIDVIRFILGIIVLDDFKTTLESTIKTIVKTHIKKNKLKITMFSLAFLKSFYIHMHISNILDPLLKYFMSILIIPNDAIKKHLYNYISEQIKKQIGIELTDNYKMVTVLEDTKKKVVSRLIESLDTGMIDSAIINENIKPTRPKTAC